MADPAPKLIALAAGVGTRSGDARRMFGGFRKFLDAQADYTPDDFVEATYAGDYREGRWVGPATYDLTAFDAPLADTVTHAAQALLHEARCRPPDVDWHLVGFSFGGLVLLEAAIVLHRRAPAWARGLRSVTTLSAPLNGVGLGELSWLGDLFGPGAVSQEIIALADDPRHRRRLAAAVDALRAAGVVVTTLAESDDVVIQPQDAIVGTIEPSLVVPTASGPDSTFVARHLGHGRIVNDPYVWERLLAIVGPQRGRRAAAPRPQPGSRAASAAEPGPRPRPTPPPSDQVLLTPPPDQVLLTPPPSALVTPPPSVLITPPPRDDALLDEQLAALKARLRAEGRL